MPPASPGSPGTPSFLERVEAKLRKAEESVPPLGVLVWGPTENEDDPWWNKRLEIREELRSLGYEAYFSEEIVGASTEAGEVERLSSHTLEFAQAKEADYIVILMGSFGSVAEFNAFGDKPDLAPKMLVFMDREHEDGFAASLLSTFEASHGTVEKITFPDDLVECNVLTRTLERIESIRDLKVRTVLEGPDA